MTAVLPGVTAGAMMSSSAGFAVSWAFEQPAARSQETYQWAFIQSKARPVLTDDIVKLGDGRVGFLRSLVG